MYPSGWELPATWDEFAGDYQTRDGWIRLHTNAAPHKAAALSVLEQQASRREAIQRVATWNGRDLENAVVEASGAAAFMMSREQWPNHEQGWEVNRESVVAWQEHESRIAGTDVLQQATPSRPLNGVRVLDMARVLGGPVSTRFLASLGAEVLRIDPPAWDEDGNALEMTLGKRCAGLDLRMPSDKLVLEALLSRAHVIVHGYHRGALPRLGLDERHRFAINPSLVDVALSPEQIRGYNQCGFVSSLTVFTGNGVIDNRQYFDSLLNQVPETGAYSINCYQARCAGIWELYE